MDSRNTAERRVRDALEFLNETLSVEFKEDQPFESLKYKIAKSAQAIANLQDGGLIIVGVKKNGAHYELQGVSQENLATYGSEIVYDFVNGYASPPIELRVIAIDFQGRKYLSILIPAFERFPVVCRKNCPDEAGKILQAGEFYVRTSPPVKSTKVMSAPMMDELLQRAASFRAAETLRILDLGGIRVDAKAGDPLRKEIDDLGDFL